MSSVDPTILKILAGSGYNLCFASNVGNQYNVAALVVPSNLLTTKNVITWSTSYSMAATTQPFYAGNIVEQGTSETLPMVFGQVYELDSWADPPSVNSSFPVPGNALGLSTGQGVDASAIVSLVIDNVGPDPTPVYVSPIEIPLSQTTFTPIAKIALWFQQNIETSTMIVLSTSKAHIMDFTVQQTKSTTYNSDGTWSDGKSAKLDYTRLVPAFVGGKDHGRRKVQ